MTLPNLGHRLRRNIINLTCNSTFYQCTRILALKDKKTHRHRKLRHDKHPSDDGHHPELVHLGRVGDVGQDEAAHLLDGQFQFLGLLPQLHVPVLELVELLLLHGRGHPSFGPAAATGHIVEMPGPAVAGLSRVARSRDHLW